MSTTDPLRFDFEVPSSGKIEVPVPLPPGSQITVFVIEKIVDETDDLVAAASSSADFWDNSLDDEDWNNA